MSEPTSRVYERTSAGLELTPRAYRRFAVRYVLTKTVLLWREVRRPRLRLFLYEVVYSLCRATDRPTRPLRRLHLDHISTIFGEFRVRPGTIDAACVSPAFERPDLDELLARVGAYLREGRRVLFLDVGADVGTYTVSVANRLRHLGELRVLAFEPASSSFEYLRTNVALNRLDDIVTVRRTALGDGSVTSATLQFDPAEPGGSGLNEELVEGSVREEVPVSTVDAEVERAAGGDPAPVVVVKLDVEGSETAVLEGAAATVAAADDVLLLVEDFVEPRIVDHLEGDGWTLVDKRTPYNSFWTRQRTPGAGGASPT
jgi:FkbM family methyltransferase